MARPASAFGEVLATAVPQTVDEVAEVVAACRRHGPRPLIRGSGTKDAYGAPTPGAWLLLSTAGLRRILRHRPEDLTVTVEAGVTLGELEAALGQAGQTLAWDVPGGEAATVGGALAAGLDGPRQAGHGRLRDDVLEVRAVLADGRAVRSGAPVVKNVAGYDLNRLWVGSWGALGCLTAVTLRVRPRPRFALTHVRRLGDDWEAASAWREAVAASAHAVGAVLLVDEEIRAVAHLEGRQAGVVRSAAALGEGEALPPETGVRQLRAALAPGGESPTLCLTVDPSEVVARLRTLRERLPGARLAGDVLNGWVRLSAEATALDEVPEGGEPYRWEGARACLGGRRLFGPPREEERLWWAVLEAFDAEGLWCRERLGLVPPPTPLRGEEEER